MASSRRALPALLALAACGGGNAGAQARPVPVGEDDLARAYVYEVAPEQLPTQAEPGFVEVSGSASVAVVPDRARASFAVETQGRTADEAADANATVMEAVVTALRASVDPEPRVETFGYSLRPDYSFPSPEDPERVRAIHGYTVVNNVRATVDDVNAVGRLIDGAVQAGANRVSSLSFEASDTEQARREALAQAVSRAREEAEAIAAALGHALGPALEVRGGAQAPTPRVQMRGAAYDVRTRAGPETPIEAAEQLVRATVTIKFALGGRTEGQ